MSTEHEHHGLTLPGYTLSTKLGAGGYGEVWLAHAPGGLTKAVKFIFGSYHDKRAEHELRALQKIKEVRHPFLLSLERIEVVDGRLVIVTELADASLKDRFDECVAQGQPGVPRDELLKYLRDAADALDYLSQRHKLQHLDVKPENLLLIGGHVKVADFGLVKDVGKSQASLVGGLTPLYSAPEVFQGAPSVHSDQYSLAVLYQEMLTGVLPFDGATAAELTLQHLHDEPNLAPLPTADRYIVSRALAKIATNRFGSCLELIAALCDSERSEAAGWSPAQPATFPEADGETQSLGSEHRPGPVTEFFGDEAESPKSGVSTSLLLPIAPPAEAEPVVRPPLDIDAQACAPQPALVIGVGGAAGQVLQQLRQRMTRQYGDDGVPAVQMLLLDSDPKSLARAQDGDRRTALRPDETLSLPLRRPQEYRDQSSRLTRWLSRRWLYNIPRSLRTEGMRPLGRLAFADHARQVVQRIRMSLTQAADDQALRASRAATGLPFVAGTPRVFVVAAVSGGAGSGMSLDVGYAVRAALDKLGAENAEIIGIFLYAAGRDPRHCDLAKVNCYSWLTEYNHFHKPGGQFPGDESCGLPAMPAGRRAFNAAYLVDLGVCDEESEFLEGAADVSEYLYLDLLTPARQFFAACRAEASPPTAAAPLRTFAVRRYASTSDAAVQNAAAMLCREVVLRWSGFRCGASADSVRDTDQIVQGAATLVGQLQLKLDGLASNARCLVEAQFGPDQNAFVAALGRSAASQGKPATTQDLVKSIDQLFAPPPTDEGKPYLMDRPLESIVSPLSMKLAGDLAKWVLSKLDDRQERLSGAQRAASWLVDHLKHVEEDAERMAEGLARQIAGVVDQLRRDARTAAAQGSAALQHALAYLRMRIDCQSVAASTVIARRLLGELKMVEATIAELGRHLKHLAGQPPRGAN
ncbi:MAG TPA: tubulin-like doman-containing protein, partial [Lacipirellulaceae bacterium]|nr:tubulin-like doman-containing protein [Lacipirellulaceae bacterium]